MHILLRNSNADFPRPPRLDARLAAAAAFVRQGSTAADIGCDHGKLSAWLAGSGRCPHVIACDLRPEPLARAKATCAPWGEQIEFRLGDGLAVLKKGEAQDFVIAGMGAETIGGILDAAPWTRDGALNFVLVPATKHSLMRQWLVRNGFTMANETLCRAAGRYYAVMQARYTGTAREPDGLWCLCGKTGGQPWAAEYRAQQTSKLKKYSRGLDPAGAEKLAVERLIVELEAGKWPEK
jgi:tRNA (adenine22-N1)-methyltransferase